eukprot:scaffold20356_cov54-Cyclotella_meneghiniana.AAC.1
MADDSDDSFWGQMWWMIPRWVGVTVEEECDKGHSFDPQRLDMIGNNNDKRECDRKKTLA